jgi:protein SCO1/2
MAVPRRAASAAEAGAAEATQARPPASRCRRKSGIDQKPDMRCARCKFTDEHGAAVARPVLGPRPVVLALVFRLPNVCQVLNGLAGSLQGVTYTVGHEYEVVVVSFDPGETPAMATERKANFVSRYIRQADAGHIHFLTGRESSIKALTGAAGFRYTRDEATGQFAHPAAIMVLTPDGRMSRYLYGVEFAPRDLKLALAEASAGQVGSIVEQALLFCYHYDPDTGRYGFAIMNLVRAAGALTVLALGFWIVRSLRRERRQVRMAAPPSTTGTR